jgi:hypothetical protein
MAVWARAADDDATRIVAVMLENTKLAVNLLRDLDDAQRSTRSKRRRTFANFLSFACRDCSKLRFARRDKNWSNSTR